MSQFTAFRYNSRGGLVMDRDSLHESEGYRRQVDALKQLRNRRAPMADTMTLEELRESLDVGCLPNTDRPRWFAAIDAAIKQREQTEDIFKWVLSSLVASVSLLRRVGKQAAPSDKMFTVMLADYEKAIEAGRAVIIAAMAKESGDE